MTLRGRGTDPQEANGDDDVGSSAEVDGVLPRVAVAEDGVGEKLDGRDL